MKRCVALLGLFVLAGAIPASATITYQGLSVPTIVIDTGRSEPMGSVRITATNAGPAVASTIQYLYGGVACDNTFASGITLVASGAFIGHVTTGTAVNTSAGCIVSFNIDGTVAPTPVAADFVEVGGVRGRIDMAFGIVVTDGQSILCSLNASPSSSSLFNPPTTLVVATLEPGLLVSVSEGTIISCIPSDVGDGEITIKEGFNSAFVQYVTTVALGSGTPVNPRPLFGANRNTRVKLVVYDLPVGVSITFPAFVDGSIGAFVPGTSGSQLQLLDGPTFTGAGPGTSFTLRYEYACGNQAVCDLNQESFVIHISEEDTNVGVSSNLGTARVNATLHPPLIGGDATLAPPNASPDPPFGAAPRPRFAEKLVPSTPAGFLAIAPCTTNLLFPWVVSNVAGFDTGIAIANTSADPFGDFGATAEHGTCTLTGFPKGEGTPVVLMTKDISTGDTFTVVLSNTVFNGFAGYIIARCGFQYGHGFAFLTNNFGTGLPPTVGQGYIALLIPDPVIIGGRFANDSSEQGPDCTTEVFSETSLCTNNTGEGLNN